MKIDFDELVLEHKISNKDEMIADIFKHRWANRTTDSLNLNEIYTEIEKKVEMHYASAFTLPLIISVKYDKKSNHVMRFRLLKSKWLKHKLDLTYEYFSID